MKPIEFDKINALLESRVAEHQLPGAVLLIGQRGETLYKKAYGYAQLYLERLKMTEDTTFDLASLTKVTATFPLILRALSENKVALSDSLEKLFPDVPMLNELKPVTVFHLLTHTAGLSEDEDVDSFGNTRQERIRGIFTMPLKSKIGEKYMYSDMGFILLGEIAARAAGRPLDEAAKALWGSLHMTHTCFNPEKSVYCAATEVVDGKVTRGTVHDERAQQLFGVAGHAGAFSTADDLALYAAALLPGAGQFDEAWLDNAFSMHTKGYSIHRGLGWELRLMREGGNLIGHTGFTGTSLWIDRASGVYTILLTNRVHPARLNHNLGPIRAEIFDCVYHETPLRAFV